MPRRANPPEGFLAAANARVNPAGKGVLVSADNAAPYRIARIRRVLSGGARLSAQDMQSLQMDWSDPQAHQLLPTLLAHTRGDLLDESATKAAALLRMWRTRPVAEPGSAAALLFQRWYLALAQRVFGEPLGELWPRLARRNYVLNQALDQLILDDGSAVWWRQRKEAMINEALNGAVAELARDLGPDVARWRLDHKQRVLLRHELGSAVPGLGLLFDAADRPWGGGASTVGRANYAYARPNAVRHGATVRAVAVMTQPPRVWSVMPGGQSGHPLSEHYLDQYAGWLHGELYPVAALPADVAGKTLVFAPR